MRTGAARVYLCTCVPVYLISHRASDKFPLLRQAQHKVSIRVRAATRPARRWNHPCSDEVHADSRRPCLPVYVCACLLDFPPRVWQVSPASTGSAQGFDSASARRRVPHGDGIAHAIAKHTKSMRTRAVRVYLCTCVLVYLIFPARLTGLPVSIPRSRGEASRTEMESPVLRYEVHADSRCPCLPVYLCTCVPVYLISHRASGRLPRFDSASARRRVPHGDGIARANIRSPCGLAPSVFTCVRVYVFTCVLPYGKIEPCRPSNSSRPVSWTRSTPKWARPSWIFSPAWA